jgi:ArsR family transcriptional regulator, arsenate/arsenite/antimonite-responsive transcriptional repressor
MPRLDDADIVKIAKALADPTRLRMLRELRGVPHLTCTGMCELFPLTQPTISHHVRTLERAGLIRIEKDGAFHRLSLNTELLSAFTAHIAADAAPKKRRRGARVAE